MQKNFNMPPVSWSGSRAGRTRAQVLALCGFILVLLSFAGTNLLAKTTLPHATVKFTHLEVKDGLTNKITYGLVQDANGLIWIGTRSGLNRYDGYEIKAFLHDPEDSNSISHNFTWFLFVDRDGVLWVVSWGGGLTRIDLEKESFTRFQHDENNPRSLSSDNAWFMYQDHEGVLWVGTETGLDRMDADGKGFTHFRHDPNNESSLGGDNISSIQEDALGRLWLGSYGGGVSVLDRERRRFRNYRHAPGDDNSLSSNNVWRVLIDREGEIWVGTEVGLNRYDPVSDSFRRYRHQPNDPHSLPADNVLDIFEDSKDRLWIGTWGGGVGLMDRKEETFHALKHDPLDPASLSNNNVPRIMEDRYGVIWFGTEDGVSKFDPVEHRFTSHVYQPGNPVGLSAPRVSAFHLDESGHLWLGTEGGGLNRLDPARRSFTHFKAAISGDQIRSILPDGSGGLWLATENGVEYFDSLKGESVRPSLVLQENADFFTGNIFDLAMDADGAILAAIYGTGVDRFDPKSGQVTRYRAGKDGAAGRLSGRWTRIIEVTADGSLWFGGEGSLDRFDPVNGQIHNVDLTQSGLADSNIYALHEDRSGRLWVGTGAGLNRYDHASRTFHSHGDSEGPLSHEIAAILDDANGNIWFSHRNGISSLNPTTGRLRSFNTFGNLQGNQFLSGVAYVSAQGEMFFGGVAGFNTFYPEQIIDNLNPAEVVLTEFLNNGKRVPICTDCPLRNSITYAQSVTLPHDYGSFTLKFSSSSMSIAENNRYLYMLEGFDGDWRDPGKSRAINYTSLDAGNYTLRIKVANNDGLWNQTPRDLRIEVTPAWWETRWAYLGYLLATLLFMTTIINLRIRGYRHRQAQMEAVVKERTTSLTAEIEERKRIEEDLYRTNESLALAKEQADAANQTKSMFLANMSHELRTPLNAILGFSEMIGRDREAPADVLKKVAVINRSGDHLLSMINDVLDLSKIEAGKIELESEAFDLPSMLEDIGRMFEVRVESTGLQYHQRLDPAMARYIKSDAGILRQVLINLLGNAVKFTLEGGFYLRARTLPMAGDPTLVHLQLEVEDSGPGIPPEQLERIFQPFVQAGRSPSATKGTGLGLAISKSFVDLMGGEMSVESTLGKGSLFRVDLPVTLTHAAQVIGAETARPAVLGLETGQPEWRILVVEDNPDNRLLLTSLLDQAGFEIREAENGEEALARFQQWRPHFIWIDMRMPVMDGFEATRRIRALPGGDTVKIVALTASALKEQRQGILEAGCDDVVHKPYQSHEIFETMADQLGIHYLFQEEPVAVSSPPMDDGGLEEALISLSPEARERLNYAALVADIESFEEALVEVERVDSVLADALKALANEYRFDRILALLEQE